jgi:hypothetical protein
MKIRAIASLAAASLMVNACASIVAGSTDEVEVVASPPANLTCSATNQRGSWMGTAPGSISVKKSRTDLELTCADPHSGVNGHATLASEVEPWVFGNILLGGIIGLGVDWGTGAAYDYPQQVTVPVGNGEAMNAAPTSVEYFEPASAPPVIEQIAEPDAPAIISPPPAPYVAEPVMIAPPPMVAPAAPVSRGVVTPEGTIVPLPF